MKPLSHLFHLFALSAMLSIAGAFTSIAHASTANQLVTQINKITGLAASASGNTVTVTGTVANPRGTMTLNIDPGVTVQWQAAYAGTAQPLISLLGEGNFTVTDGGNIRNTNKGNAINASGSVTVTVTGSAVGSYGSVTAGSGSAINCSDRGNTVHVTGYGYVASSVTSSLSAVVSMEFEDMKNDEISTTNVFVGDNATVAALATTRTSAYAIRTYGSVQVDGGQIYSLAGLGRGINVIGVNSTVTVNGGWIWSNGDDTSAAISTANTDVGGVDASIAVANAKIFINGGTVQNLGTGIAIRTSGTSSQVTVTCGLVASTTGYAISNEASGDNSISVTGGMVFGYGTGVKDNTSNEYNIFHTTGSSDGSRVTIAAPALAVAWDNQVNIYAEDANDNLKFAPASPDPGLSWQNFPDGKAGFNYTATDPGCDVMQGRFPLPVKVTSDYGLIFDASSGIMYRNMNGSVDEGEYSEYMSPQYIYEDGKGTLWDSDGATLYLMGGFQWATTTQSALIITGGDATIELAGANNLYTYSTGDEPPYNSYSGLYVSSNLNITVEGNGQLNAFAGTEQMEGSFTDLTGSQLRFYSGIYTDNGNITINSGILAGWGLTNYTNGNGEGIFFEGGITFNGGLLAAGGSASACAAMFENEDDLLDVYTYYTSTESPESLLAAGYDVDKPYTGVAPYDTPYEYNTDDKVVMISLYPFALIEDVTVEGTAGLPMEQQTATATLHGDKVNIEGFTDEDATGWFASLPYGVRVTATAAANSNEIEFTFAGTPRDAGTTVMSIAIPETALAGVIPIAVQPNPDAKIDIAPRAALSLSLASETLTYTGLPLYISPVTMRGAIAEITTEPIVYSYLNNSTGERTTSALNADTYTVTVSVADNDHYIGTEATATLTINKAQPRISATAVVTPYTGSPVNVNVASITGSTTADADLRGTLKYEYRDGSNNVISTTPTGPTTSGVYTVKVRTEGDRNHEPFETTVDIVITEDSPMMSIANAEKEYDGTPLAPPKATISVASLEEDITYTIIYTHNGLGETVTPVEVSEAIEAGKYSVTAHTAGDENYTAASVTSTLTIMRKQAVVTMHSKSVHYGTAYDMAPMVTTPSTGAEATVKSYEGIHGTNYPKATGKPSAVGEYEVTATYEGNNNYLPASITATLAITQASAPRIDMQDVEVTYNAQPHYVDKATVKVWSPVEDEDGNSMGSTDITGSVTINYTYHDEQGNLVADPTNAGNYTITATTVATAQYAAATATAQLFIRKATQTITFSLPESIIFGSKPFVIEDAILHRPPGANDRPLSFASDNTGIATIEDLADAPGSSLPGEPDRALVTLTGEGTVNITVSETSNRNFYPASVTKTMIVTKATLTVTLNDGEATYTGRPVSINPARVVGAIPEVSHNNVVYTYEGTDGTTYPSSNTPPTNAGTYKVTATVPANTYYDAATDEAVLTVRKSTPSIDVTGGSREYTGEEQPIDDPVVTGADPDNEPEIIYEGKDGTSYGPSTTPPTEAGDYTVTVKVPADENHEKAEVTVTLTIVPVDLNLNLEGVKNKVYDGVPVTRPTVPGASEKGMDVELSYTGTDGTTYGPSSEPPTDAGHYTVTATVTDPKDNYNDVTLTKDFDITKALPVVDITNRKVVYTGSPVSIAYTVVKGDAAATVTETYTGASGTTYPENTAPPSDRGSYVITVEYEESDNYVGRIFYGSLLITTAPPHITMADKTVTYNGQEQTLTAEVTEGGLTTEVTYHNESRAVSDEPPVDAGVYSVTASTAATGSYEAGSITATLTILKAPQTITFELPANGKTGAPFDVNAVVTSEGVTDYKPQPLTYSSGNTDIATISNTGVITPLRPGIVTITVSQAGSGNYLPAQVTKTLTVVLGSSPDPSERLPQIITFNLPKCLSPGDVFNASAGVNSKLPLTYTSSNPEVASIDDTGLITVHKPGEVTFFVSQPGNDEYLPEHVSGSLTITDGPCPDPYDPPEKLPQIITFDLQECVSPGDIFYANASVDSELPLTYTSSNPEVASIDNTGRITVHKPGEVTFTVSQPGNDEYLPVSVTRALCIESDEMSDDDTIHSATVNDEETEVSDDGAMTYVMDCDDDGDAVTVRLTIASGATVSYTVDGVTITDAGSVFSIPLDRPQRKTVTITITSQDGKKSRNYTLALERRIPFFQIVLMRWNNTLTVINNPANNGGYTSFNTYKWYRSSDNGETYEPFAEGQSWSAGSNGELLSETDWFYVEVTSNDFEGTLRTCPARVTLTKSMNVTAYPNPVSAGQTLYVEADMDEKDLDGAVIEVYNATGYCIGILKVQGRYTQVEGINYQPGLNIFVLKRKDGFKKGMKVLVIN